MFEFDQWSIWPQNYHKSLKVTKLGFVYLDRMFAWSQKWIVQVKTQNWTISDRVFGPCDPGVSDPGVSLWTMASLTLSNRNVEIS